MLSIENLSKTYDNGVHALRGVNLEIPNGMFGLLGPNGAGKSTLMRTLATLQEADSGRIVFNGRDVTHEKDKVRKLLGYLPQDFGVYPRISAEALLDHLAVLKGLSQAKERRDVVHGLLHMTNLYTARKRKLGTYSGGMLRRFGIAQALLGEPQLIIVDEPTAGLDPEERQRFLNLLSEVGENAVVILSTHHVADVHELCSRLAILSHGQILLCGDPDSVLADLDGKIWRKTVAKHEVDTYRESMAVISTRLVAGRTILHVFSEQLPEEGFEAVEADLEDVYFCALRAM